MNDQNRSISIGGNVTGAAIVAGDHNRVSVTYEKTELPPAASVDIAAEVAALKQLLADLQMPAKEKRKMDNAIEDAELEAKEKKPEKAEIGASVERALKYAEKAGTLAAAIDKLKPHVKNLSAWLGQNYDKLLAMVGLAV